MIDFPTSKRCPSCGETKGAGHFYVRQNESRRLTGWCRQCVEDKARARAAANPERRREISLAYARSEKGKAQRAARAATPEAIAQRMGWSAKNPEARREIGSRWQRDHPMQHRQRQQRRRARKLAVFVEDVHPRVAYEMHGGRCGICGEFIEGEFHVDHVIPLSRGGLHSYANSQPAHPLCNARKGAR